MASVIAVAPVRSARARLKCWGDLAITDAASGADLRPRSRKARALFAYLALHPDKPVSRERLAGLLWGDRGEEQARASLRQALVELKPLTNGPVGAITVERDHLALEPAAVVTDIIEMHAAAAAGDYEALLSLLPDPDERLFANFDDIDEGFDDWLTIVRARQADALVVLVSDASDAARAQGRIRDAEALCARLREFDPEADPEVPQAGPRPMSRPAPIAAERESPATRNLRWRVAVLVAVLLTISILAIAAWQIRRTGPEPPASIAIIPFRNLSGGEQAYFADGLTEEIMAQLARDPELRVAGRSSSWQFKGQPSDPGQIGRKLDVAYVLEGSVRSAGDRVRVNVALVKASDGMQLWAETFDGALDDIFAIQHRIGVNVAGAIGSKLASAQQRTGTLATSGQVYSLYLAARGLIRERNPQAMIAARERLKRALALDPRFAPAWSSMAQVKRWEGNGPGVAGQMARAEALAHARRALALAPDLAEAHGVLGMILGFENSLGQRHIKRAATLDPYNAEFQFWLGNALMNEPNFPAALAARRRAFAIDPLWTLANDYAVLSAWRMGQRDEAIGYVRRIEREGSRHDAHMARGNLAMHSGDLSRAALEYGAARASTDDPGRQSSAINMRSTVLLQLGFFDRDGWAAYRRFWAREQKQRPEMPHLHAAHLALRQGKLPTAAELASADRGGDPAGQVLVAAMTEALIRAGRAGDAVALYDSEEGLLGLSTRRPDPKSFNAALNSAPIVAATLREVGRRAEADRLLRHADRMIADALRRSGGRAPADIFGEAAQTWALLGKHDAALAGLERATRNGWINAVFPAGDLADDLGDKPAFASLRGNPRFEAIRGRLNGALARERREVSP